MTSEKYREHAKELAKDAISLISKIIEKHDAAILEELHDQLKSRDEEIGKLKKTLETAIAWQVDKFGQHGVNQLIDELNT